MNRQKSSEEVGSGVCAAGQDCAGAALRTFLRSFAFLQPEVLDYDSMTDKELAIHADRVAWLAVARGRVDSVVNSTADSWFWVELNGVRLQLPRYTVMTMRHCIHGSEDRNLKLWVETAHWRRIKENFGVSTMFVDIGAATGAMTIPYAVACPKGLRVVAFEPSRRARGYLEAAVSRNSVNNVLVRPFALSDTAGSFAFMELPEDDTGDIPYLPETSRLIGDQEALQKGSIRYDVDVSTLDGQMESVSMEGVSSVVMKIDVEGHEDKVLRGGLGTIAKYKPYLSIDIHHHPGTATSTDVECARILSPLGYEFERIEHVLLARHVSGCV